MRYAHKFGFFSIDAMPNQPSVAWCSDFTVFKEFRGCGNGYKLKLAQNKMLSDLGFTHAMCSVKESNTAQLKVLANARWFQTTSFKDVRTSERIQLWNFHIDQGL